MMQVYIYEDKVFFLCKVGELCKLIQEYVGEYKTVQELINAYRVQCNPLVN